MTPGSSPQHPPTRVDATLPSGRHDPAGPGPAIVYDPRACRVWLAGGVADEEGIDDSFCTEELSISAGLEGLLAELDNAAAGLAAAPPAAAGVGVADLRRGRSLPAQLLLLSGLPVRSPLVRSAYQPGRWIVFRYDLERRRAPAGPLGVEHRLVLGRIGAEGRRHDQPFLIGPDGRPDIRVNEFFGSRRMLARSPLTWKKYGHTLALWLNFLLVLGRCWDSATEDDAEYFKEWRLTDVSNPRPVDGATFSGDLAALRSFYRWAARQYGINDAVATASDFDLRPRGVRDRDIKWLDPGGYRRWRDLGLRGHDRDGRPEAGWRGRNEQRDAAFADGLYGSGLRLIM